MGISQSHNALGVEPKEKVLVAAAASTISAQTRRLGGQSIRPLASFQSFFQCRPLFIHPSSLNGFYNISEFVYSALKYHRVKLINTDHRENREQLFCNHANSSKQNHLKMLVSKTATLFSKMCQHSTAWGLFRIQTSVVGDQSRKPTVRAGGFFEWIMTVAKDRIIAH